MKGQDTGNGQTSLKERVVDSDLCTGCGACVSICPYQKTYEDNIIMLNSCDRENGNCYEFCPRTPTDLDALKKHFFSAKDLTPEIGAVKAFYITRAADESLREKAQHGGTVTALMALAVKEGIVDTAINSKNADILLPQGVSATDPEKVKNNSKSNFCVSPTVAEFNRISQNGTSSIGVVATPCQSLALYKMKIKQHESHTTDINKLKLVIGLFCGWALSWKELTQLITRKGIDTGAITGMDILPSNYQVLEIYTENGVTRIPLDEVTPSIRQACSYCFDMTAEFSDISVGSARLPGGWDESKTWNHLIVRSDLGNELIELARSRGVLEFHEVPEDNVSKLKAASMNKKKNAVKNLIEKSGSKDDLLYLDCRDPVLSELIA